MRSKVCPVKQSVYKNVLILVCITANYHIPYLVIRQLFSYKTGFPFSRYITKSVLRNFALIPVLPFLNNPKDLDPAYKMDLDFWDCFGRKISPTYNQRNTVPWAQPKTPKSPSLQDTMTYLKM